MNNLYYIRKDDRLPPIDEVELKGERYDIPVIEERSLRDLADSAATKSAERRYHKRIQLNKDAFALIRSISARPLKIVGKSMGSIACEVFNAQPAKLGTIDNISMGGLTFQYIDNKFQIKNTVVLDILLAECGFYLAGIPFRIITDFVISEDIPGVFSKMRQVRLQFQKLNVDQLCNLKGFILNYGAENAEIGTKD